MLVEMARLKPVEKGDVQTSRETAGKGDKSGSNYDQNKLLRLRIALDALVNFRTENPYLLYNSSVQIKSILSHHRGLFCSVIENPSF